MCLSGPTFGVVIVMDKGTVRYLITHFSLGITQLGTAASYLPPINVHKSNADNIYSITN